MIQLLFVGTLNALRENMNVLNKFNEISGLKLNKKKTKAMWIGLAKNNKTKPLGFQPYQTDQTGSSPRVLLARVSRYGFLL